MLLAALQAVPERFQGFYNIFMMQSQNPLPQNSLFISLARLADACQDMWVSETGGGVTTWCWEIPVPPLQRDKNRVISPSFVVQWPQR